jgi:Tol biopolymer transport system component
MSVGGYWFRVLLAGVLVLPAAVLSAPEVAQAAEPTVLSAVELPGALQVGQMAADTVRVSGPVGRPVQVQFRTAGAPWRTAVTLVTNPRHRVRVAVAVTTTGGRLVWQARQRNGLWAVAGRTSEPVGQWRVRAPAVPGWTRAVSPAERVQAERFPLWIRRVNVSSTGTQASQGGSGVLSADGRYVAFDSVATDLVRRDTNRQSDVFVHDRATGRTSRVSVSSTGAQANDESYGPALSADGRYVAFTSSASNLVRRDTSHRADVFVHDRATGRTSRVSVSSTGTEANGGSTDAAISADGRFVAFRSQASNLVPRDRNREADVFVHDRATGQTSRVSVSSTGTQANDSSVTGALSTDGRYVTFGSRASNLVPGDTNDSDDVFVHDRVTRQTSRVSVSSTGTQANRASYRPTVSADGRYVAFESGASNLVPGDTNRHLDVFVHDRVTRQTSRVSVSSTGTQINGWSYDGAISPDGRSVAFTSVVVRGVGNVLVHDRASGQTRLVAPGNAGTMSADGRFVALDSDAPYLVTGDTNRRPDVFVARLR